ncbi:troponin I, fast skeletal muscle-like [Pundamilia nyererei]|uniref:Troponin I, fast skeletal muscle-like n=3 Tax=Haplochromini TaxID=319058 RepID=A0A3B4GSK6_9CICH|nr:PREDICTED: troponin I, fast skeletal muscle-like [Pundamilia nyererei]XP_014185928.1 troponin I, fast skeletal muscle isoform X1 [Haplochromis burtoni]XP_039902867.1 troponin I, fast skeletal muscle-like [Simochromis diagramma]XP_042071688.1 troponin I, fast skeletal muscle isoform X1 [Haplochromis burtoni]
MAIKVEQPNPRPSPYIPHRVSFLISDSLTASQPFSQSLPASSSSLCRVRNLKEATMSEGKKMTSSRRHHLKSLMLQIAANLLEQEAAEIIVTKEAYLAENCAALDLSRDQAALMDFCKKLHQAIDKIDEERYDTQVKVEKADKEINELKMKVIELAGVKKPALKKVRMSADAMLKALLGSKHTVNMDLRANLKQVKKEVKEESAEVVGDWRKNIEDKADRKKMFETS